MGDTDPSDGGATTLDDRSQVLVLAAEMAAERGVDLAAFLEVNPDAMDGLEADDADDSAPIDLTDDGEDAGSTAEVLGKAFEGMLNQRYGQGGASS